MWKLKIYIQVLINRLTQFIYIQRLAIISTLYLNYIFVSVISKTIECLKDGILMNKFIIQFIMKKSI